MKPVPYFRLGASASLAALIFAAFSCRPRVASGPGAASPGTPASMPGNGAAGTVDAPAKASLALEDEVFATFFVDDIAHASGGYTYSYGGKTHNQVLHSTDPDNPGVFGAFFDNGEYSGVNISRGNSAFVDVTPYRKTGSLTFWVKEGPGAKKFFVGLMDNPPSGKKVQTKVNGDDYVVGKEGEWVRCRIPLKAFSDDGMYWDASQGREFSGKIDWSKITDVRFSINRDENKVPAGQEVVFYFDQIELTKTSKGIEDPDAYWDAFKSDAPVTLVTDFTKWADAWKTQHGTSADIAAAVTAAPKGAPASAKGKALKIDYKPGDWFDVYTRPDLAPGMVKDWSKHYGVSVWLYGEKPYQSFDFVILDRDHEMFLAKAGAGRGWNQILIPFRNFVKFPYYQPPEAKLNNKLDLDGISQFGVKPGGDVPGTIYLADVELTNARAITKAKAPAQLPATFKGDLNRVAQKIPDIYGMNVGKWMPEVLDAASLAPEKQLGMGVVRYPGGLLADEEDWQKTLKAKDSNVDTDEFLDWCQKVNCTPMFTANVGNGTPEMAAAWVKYVNQTRKGPKVQLWEIGNEIYGDWHRFYAKWGKDGGTAYGKAVREFVKAMKAADPTIKVTAVWMLNGAWNKAVFKECADVVDGVNVHNYSQHALSENDDALLAASSEATSLIQGVKAQLAELGVKGKKYSIWLTEWNSVDQNPGPQILQHVESLFVADYLGHLAESPVDIANLWVLYNGRDKRLGDYSVLAPKGDPQGFNFERPAFWGFEMLSNTLRGSLLEGKSDQEQLSAWMAKRPDGKIALVLVNKSFETDFKTTLEVPGLKGEATVDTLTVDNSGGLLTGDPTGKTHPGVGPKSEHLKLGTGSQLVVPKASVVTVVF